MKARDVPCMLPPIVTKEPLKCTMAPNEIPMPAMSSAIPMTLIQSGMSAGGISRAHPTPATSSPAPDQRASGTILEGGTDA